MGPKSLDSSTLKRDAGSAGNLDGADRINILLSWSATESNFFLAESASAARRAQLVRRHTSLLQSTSGQA
jgi:hypothetical protein